MVDAGEVKTNFETQILTHPDTTTETDLIEFTNLREKLIIAMDLSNLAQITTIRVFNKTDGTNYRQRSQKIFPTDYDTGTEEAVAILSGTNQDMKITLESGITEGAARTIPLAIREESTE